VRRAWLPASLVVAAAAAATGSPAAASPTQVSIIQDEQRLVYASQETRTQTLDRIKALGAQVAKVTVNWRAIAPSGASKPSGFAGDDPADYAPAAWAPYDAFVREAAARGLRLFFLVGGRAPDWASGPALGEKQGANRPNPSEFGRFVKALGKRYSGSYVPAAAPAPPPGPPPPPPCPVAVQPGEPCPIPIPPRAALASAGARARAADAALPRVSTWSVWNEPNLSGWLQPQYLKRTVPISPTIYRQLFLAAHASLAATGHGGDSILFGELLPFARGGKIYPSRVSPLAFLREMACVDKRYRPYRGGAAVVRGCTGFSPLPGSGLAYHPYTLAGGPETPTPLQDDATINDLTRLDRTLAKLARRGRFARRTMPVWLTEFGYQTNPPDPFASSISQVPQFMSESEWLAYHDRRVKSYAQYPLIDDPTQGTSNKRFSGFQSGLLASNGRPKKGVYQAYQTPLFVRLVSKSRVEIFGAVRGARPGTRVTLQSGRGAGFAPLRGGGVTLNAMGYFDKVLGVSNASGRRFRFGYGNGLTSIVARPLKRPRAGALYPPNGRKGKQRSKRAPKRRGATRGR
jgi:hypothetical protein